MKRLVDSSTSDFSRSLLKAGIEHEPPAHGRMKLLLALGVGGGLTLATSKALAWLATSAGKVTVLAAGIAVSGATVYLANDTPPIGVLRATSQNVASSPQAVDEVATIPLPKLAEPRSSVEATTSVVTTPTAAFPLEVSPPQIASKVAVAKRTHRRTKSHIEKPSRIASRSTGDQPTRLTPKPEGSRQWSPVLEQEIELVDRIRLAVEARDGTHVRLARRYRRLYPNGQLRIEVERLCQFN